MFAKSHFTVPKKKKKTKNKKHPISVPFTGAIYTLQTNLWCACVLGVPVSSYEDYYQPTIKFLGLSAE